MAKVIRMPRAQADLVDILAQVGRHSRPAARKLAKAVRDRCRLLKASPGMGAARNDLRAGIRSVVVENKYLIFYRVVEDVVQILRIVHGARELSASLFDED